MSIGDDLARAARKALLKQISITDRLIRQLYMRAAKMIAKQIETAKAGSLTESWLAAYRKELEKEIERLGRGLYGAITDGAKNAAEARVEYTAEYLRRAAAQARIDDSFVGVLASVPTDALRAVIDGKLYTDGRKLSGRIWSATGRLEGQIEELLLQGIAQKTDALTLARHLEAYINPKAACPVSWHSLYPDIPFERKVDYNALRLARTTITHANWIAGREAAKKNPLCRGIRWNLSDAHYERQVAVAGEDVCDEYARHDEGLGRGVWPVDKLPLPHPQCLCYQTEALPDLDEAAKVLGSWVAGETDGDALEEAFRKWERENAQELDDWQPPREPASMQRFTDNDVSRAAIEAGAQIPEKIARDIETAYRRIAEDFPVLGQMTGKFHFGNEPGIGGFGTSLQSDGMFVSGIRFDADAFSSEDKLQEVFAQTIASGYTRNTSDPMFIVSHELGHALHTAAAIKDLGLSLDKPMTPLQYKLVQKKREELSVDVFLHVEAFESENFGTMQAIYQAIEAEMGRRGCAGGSEFIAQSVAMVYNGDGAHPIADAVVRYLMGKLR